MLLTLSMHFYYVILLFGKVLERLKRRLIVFLGHRDYDSHLINAIHLASHHSNRFAFHHFKLTAQPTNSRQNFAVILTAHVRNNLASSKAICQRIYE